MFRHVAPESVVMNAPTSVPTYQTLGSCGSQITAFTGEAGSAVSPVPLTLLQTGLAAEVSLHRYSPPEEDWIPTKTSVELVALQAMAPMAKLGNGEESIFVKLSALLSLRYTSPSSNPAYTRLRFDMPTASVRTLELNEGVAGVQTMPIPPHRWTAKFAPTSTRLEFEITIGAMKFTRVQFGVIFAGSKSLLDV